jgi:ABC-2 type transport system ATP-binding protein
MRRTQIDVRGLGKSYGAVRALADVSFQVGSGSVLGVLGHNGAGKTTLIDILATRIRPTTGTARVCGWDVARSGHRVRQHIGITGQFAAVDDAMSGRDNLVLMARLLGASARQARTRADELIELLDLSAASTRKAGTYSGGMRRRLDLAVSLLARPEVLFLDEPTTGLDPVSRVDVWRFVEELTKSGTTVVLTTQDLEEADRLANWVTVLAAGRVVASGTPERLKAQVGRRTVTVALAGSQATRNASVLLARSGMNPLPDDERWTVTVPIADPGDVPVLVRVLDAGGIGIRDLTVTEPSLNDVYISLHRSGRIPA